MDLNEEQEVKKEQEGMKVVRVCPVCKAELHGYVNITVDIAEMLKLMKITIDLTAPKEIDEMKAKGEDNGLK